MHGARLHDTNHDLSEDDRYARTMGTLALEMVGRRVMSLLTVLRGWYQRLLRMTLSAEEGRKAVQIFRRDLINFQRAERLFLYHQYVAELVRASPFQTVSCKQWVCAF